MDRFLASDRRSTSLLFISYSDAGLFSELSDVPLQRFLEPVIVEDRGMQRLRQTAQSLQRRLRNLAHLRQLDAECGIRWKMLSGAAQHRADRRQDLAELV